MVTKWPAGVRFDVWRFAYDAFQPVLRPRLGSEAFRGGGQLCMGKIGNFNPEKLFLHEIRAYQ